MRITRTSNLSNKKRKSFIFNPTFLNFNDNICESNSHFKLKQKRKDSIITNKINCELQNVIDKAKKVHSAVYFRNSNSLCMNALTVWHNARLRRHYYYEEQLKELELMMTDETSIINNFLIKAKHT